MLFRNPTREMGHSKAVGKRRMQVTQSKTDATGPPTTTPPWELPRSHSDNLLIEIGILKQAVGWLCREVQTLMQERAANGR